MNKIEYIKPIFDMAGEENHVRRIMAASKICNKLLPAMVAWELRYMQFGIIFAAGMLVGVALMIFTGNKP